MSEERFRHTRGQLCGSVWPPAFACGTARVAAVFRSAAAKPPLRFTYQSGSCRYRTPRMSASLQPARPCGRTPKLFSEFVQVLDERHHGAVVALHIRIGRLDHVVLVRRVRAAAVAEAEVAGGEAQRWIGEDVSGI